MDGGERAWVAGIHGIHKRAGFGTAQLSKQDAIGLTPKGSPQKSMVTKIWFAAFGS